MEKQTMVTVVSQMDAFTVEDHVALHHWINTARRVQAVEQEILDLTFAWERLGCHGWIVAHDEASERLKRLQKMEQEARNKFLDAIK
jgi:hypothetical protein